jgi:hypothetical protein
MVVPLLAGMAAIGCVPKAAMRVSVIPDVPAEVQVREGDAPPGVVVSRCILPCVVLVERGTTPHLGVYAAGYHPASFEVPFFAVEIMAAQTPDRVAVLAVPLVPVETDAPICATRRGVP